MPEKAPDNSIPAGPSLPAGKDTSLDNRILTALRRIIRATDMHSRNLVRSHGLTTPQLLLMRQLEAAEPLTISDLARRMELSQPTVTGIVARLERRRFVTKGRGEVDRRCVAVQLTVLGRRMLATAPSPLQERFRQRLANLDRAAQARMLRTLNDLVAMMDADTLDAAPLLLSGPIDEAPLRGVAAPLDRPSEKGTSDAP